MKHAMDNPVCSKCNLVMIAGVAHGNLFFDPETSKTMSLMDMLKVDFRPHGVQVGAYKCERCGALHLNAKTLGLINREKEDTIIY